MQFREVGTKNQEKGLQKLSSALFNPVDGASVAFFRICFGFLVPLELLHYFLFRPFLEEFYFNPTFHFKYPLFEWVPDLPGIGVKILLVVISISFVMMGLGLFYRITRWTSFLSYSFLFLMERASFLNHWYMVCLFGFLLLFIPAERMWSLDARRNKKIRSETIEGWHLYALVGLMSIVYFYSGFVKINGDWLQGMQMKQYLLNSFGEGPTGLAMLASWGVVALEILMVPLLLWRKTRLPVFIITCLFHLANTQLFTVGLFPYMMILFTLLYFPPDWPKKFLQKIRKQPELKEVPKGPKASPQTKRKSKTKSASKGKTGEPQKGPFTRKLSFLMLGGFFLLQILLPLRSMLYKGNQLWTEEGLIWSWKMMLEAKTNADNDAIIYWVKTGPSAAPTRIVPREQGLTWAQENKLVRNPDLILQFAHELGRRYDTGTGVQPEVYVDAFLGLNGRPIQRFIHPNVNLNAQKRRYIKPYPWVMPLLE